MRRKFYFRFILLAFLLLGLVFPAIPLPKVEAASPDAVNSLIRCLNSRGFKMYGRAECSACDIEKGYFGENFKYISYINCDENRELCETKNIHGFPTWEDGSGRQYKGAVTIETLAKTANCKIVTQTPVRSSNISPTSLITAFIAGLISFFAPCLLPLLPSYFSVITGFTFADLYGLNFEKIRSRVFFSSLFFAAGFAVVFTILGATGSIVGQLLDTYMPLLLKTSGIFIIFLGLLQLGVIKVELLQFDFAWRVQKRLAHLGFITAAVTGVAAALAWIPCIGPLLTPILILSAKSETVLYGSILLFVYSLGLTMPFLLAGLFFPSVIKLFQNHRVLFHRISQAAGVFLIVFGMVLLTDKYRLFIQHLNSVLQLLLYAK